jgi:hypothetical protein
MHSDAKRPRVVGDFKEPSPSDRKLHSTLPKVFGRVNESRPAFQSLGDFGYKSPPEFFGRVNISRFMPQGVGRVWRGGWRRGLDVIDRW